MFKTIKNALKTPDVRKKLLYTLLLIVIFRLGCYITVPGVDSFQLAEAFSGQGISSLIDMISGGAFSRLSIFAMSISPYITASIVIQLLGMVIPSLERLMKEEHAEGLYFNEKLVGEALRGYTDRVFVSSKFGHKFVNGVQVKTEEDSTPANIRRVCENSLRNLGVETLGVFYQHRIDPNTPIEVVAETVGELIKEGKILHWGMCEVNAETIRRAHGVCPVTAIQSEYHFMHRAVEENGVLAVCEELGIGFVPYSPLNRGFLGGMINEYTKFNPDNDNRQTLPRFQPDAIRANTRIVEVLNAFGRTRGLTPAQIALAWLMNKKPFIVPIPGTTKLSHLEENLRATDVVFTDDEVKELEKIISSIPVMGNRYDALQESKVQK